MSRGQTPRHRHDGPLRIGWGLTRGKRRGGCRADSCGHAATGEPPGIHDAEPWRVALQARPGTFTPWPCGRTAALASAARRNRARGRCRTPTRRSRRMGGKRKGVKGHSRSIAAAPPVSHSEATDRPLQLSYPTPAPGLRDADPGRGRLHRVRRTPAGSAARAALARLVSKSCRIGLRADAARRVRAATASRGLYQKVTLSVQSTCYIAASDTHSIANGTSDVQWCALWHNAPHCGDREGRCG